MPRKIDSQPGSFQNPEAFKNDETADEMSRNLPEDNHFSVGGQRSISPVDYPLPPDPHAGPPGEHRQPDSRFNELEIAADIASRRGGR
jgi:hypothetical protein